MNSGEILRWNVSKVFTKHLKISEKLSFSTVEIVGPLRKLTFATSVRRRRTSQRNVETRMTAGTGSKRKQTRFELTSSSCAASPTQKATVPVNSPAAEKITGSPLVLNKSGFAVVLTARVPEAL
jgi:hypothetical protein